MPIKEFKKSGTLLAKQINPKKITSVAIVAYGRDHVAEIYVKELEFIILHLKEIGTWLKIDKQDMNMKSWKLLKLA